MSGASDLDAWPAPPASGTPLDLLRISRPRFWLYLGGTYLVGFAAGAEAPGAFLSVAFWLALAYFLVPANLFLYGINDLFDEDTDLHNPKKGAREHLLRSAERSRVRAAVLVSAGLGLALTLVLQGAAERAFLLAFLALGAAYSAPPVRLKARPVWDSASNVLYAMPGFLGYAQVGGALPPWPAVVGATAWTAAMHLFSAVPDIAADRAAGLRTTATVLGPRGALLACAVLWSVAAATAIALIDAPAAAAALVYPAVPLVLIARPAVTARAYWAFPYINAIAGFGLFAMAAARLLAR